MRAMLIAALLLAASVSALGIAPASQELACETATLEYRIYNNEFRAHTVTISYNGSLAPYLSSERSLAFAPNEPYKVLRITASIPEDASGTLKADIAAKADKQVTARLVMQCRALPAGMATAVPEEGPSLKIIMYAVLAVIALGNVLFLLTRQKQPRSAEQALARLKRMGDNSFRKLVTEEKNEVADWLEAGDPELALKLYDIGSRKGMVAAIEDHLRTRRPKKSQDELRKEITELKRELDTFEFR